jgi:hypothetical protein
MSSIKISHYFISAALAFLLLPGIVRGQCSDAGICSINQDLLGNPASPLQLLLQYRYGYSGSDDRINYHQLNLNASYDLLETLSLHLFFPFSRQSSGPDGKVSGIGDIILMGKYDFAQLGAYTFKGSLGLKFASGGSNVDALLPQSYQPGLGTNDILFGVAATASHWQFSTGYQFVEKTFSENFITPIRRSDDIYFQAAYLNNWQELDYRLELLFIQSMGPIETREVTVDNPTGAIIDVDGSDQAQLNLGGQITYPFLEKQRAIFGLAMPIINRDTNIDGLRRSISIWLGWQVAF